MLDTILHHFREDRTQRHLEKLLRASAQKFGYDDGQEESPKAKRGKVQALSKKWWPEHKEMIRSFVERTADDGQLLVAHLRKQLLESKSKAAAVVSKKHVIVGMGGIGKTSTAKWYANKYEGDYEQILWIDSEGRSLANSLGKLGKKPGVVRDEWSSFEEFVAAIYEELSGFTCLFVFDNAERFDGENGLRTILPRAEDHHAIIASRNHDWGHANEFGRIPTFELGVFTETECLSLFSVALAQCPSAKPGTEAEIFELGAELGFLPLALQCAVATILKSRRYTVASYLERIRADRKSVVWERV